MFTRMFITRRNGYLFSLCILCAVVLLALSSAALAQAGPEQSGPYPTLLIKGAIVIDGTGAPAKGPQDILIKNTVIVSLTPSDPISRSRVGDAGTIHADRVIDAQGMYVMPGIIDMHMHYLDIVPLDYQYKLLLGQGITTVRAFNIGNDTPQQMVEVKKQIAANKIIAPRLYVYPFWRAYPNDPRFSLAKDAPAIVREWKAMGVDGIKMASLPGEYPDVFKAITDTTKQLGMGVAVHIAQEAVYPMNAVRVAQGASTVEHHYGYAEASFTDQTIQQLPPDYNYSIEPERFYETGAVWLQANLSTLHGKVIDELLKQKDDHNFTMVPTMVVYEANRDLLRAETRPFFAQYALPKMMEQWQPNPHNHGSYFYHWTSEDEATWSRMYRRWMDFVQDYKNRGGLVAVGSDPGFIFNLWGFGTIREIELLEDAGFNPLEAIHSATEVGALSLGNHQLGAIRPGYTADLLVLTANPLDDIKVLYANGATRKTATGEATQVKAVKYTIRDGVVFDSQQLLKDVRDMVSKAKAAAPAGPIK